MPILPILGLIFITLKLTDTIDWSWWLVLSPFIATVVIVVLTLGFVGWIATKLR